MSSQYQFITLIFSFLLFLQPLLKILNAHNTISLSYIEEFNLFLEEKQEIKQTLELVGTKQMILDHSPHKIVVIHEEIVAKTLKHA